jgi:hypothetical protein
MVEQRVVKVNLGSGLIYKIPFITQEIYEKMNFCDNCGSRGEIWANFPNFRLDWTGNEVVCSSCKVLLEDSNV